LTNGSMEQFPEEIFMELWVNVNRFDRTPTIFLRREGS
jgi:hypothetical protein